MKRAPFVLALAVALACAPGGESKPLPPRKPAKGDVEELMRRKVTQAQKVLEGIALADHDKIARHAEELIEISKQARWKVVRTPLYEMYSVDFRNNAGDLVKAAKRKNTDAAALAYVELTLTCVRCHKHVREKRVALEE